MPKNKTCRRKRIRRTGTVCIAVGVLLVAAGLCLFVWNEREAKLAKDAAEEALTRLKEEIEEDPSQTGQSRFVEEALSAGQETPACEIDGYSYIGYVSIPQQGLELPVMEQWSYPRLKIAPCRYDGSVDEGNLIIAAHNYPRHFGGLSKLGKGDEVFFTDTEGVVFHYQVEAVDVLAPEAVEEMRDAGYDLTLFTCTYGGASRVTVRCRRVNESDGY